MSVYTNSSGNLSRAWALASGFSVAGWVRFQAVPTGNQALFTVDNGSSEITLFGAAEGTVDWYSTGTGNVVPVMTAITGWSYFGFRVSSTAANGITTITRNAGSSTFTKVLADGIGAGVTPTVIRIANDFNAQIANATFAGWKIWTAALTDQELIGESFRLAPWRTRQLYSYLDMRSVAGAGQARNGVNKFTVSGTFVLGTSQPPVVELFDRRPVIVLASGGANTPMTLTVTQTQTLSQARVLALPRSVTSTQTPSRVRALALLRSATGTQTPSMVRGIVPLAKTVTNTQTPSMVRALGLPRAVTSTQTVTLGPRALGLLRSVTSTQTLSQVRALTRSLAATSVQTPALSRALGKPLLATATQTPSHARALGLLRSVTSTQTPSRSRALTLLRSVTQAQTPSMLRALALLRSVTATASPGVQFSGHNFLAFAATITQTPSLQRAVTRLRSVTATQTPAITRALSVTRVGTNAQAPAVVRALTRALIVQETQTPSRLRAVGLVRAVAATQAPSLGPRALALVRAVTSTQTVSRSRALTRALTVLQQAFASLVTSGGTTAPEPCDAVITEARVWSAEAADLSVYLATITETRMVYELGDLIRLSVAFTLRATGAPVDPTTVTLQIQDPDGAQSDHSNAVRDSAGRYHFDVLPNAVSPHARPWHYRWIAQGSVECARTGFFVVSETPFAPP